MLLIKRRSLCQALTLYIFITPFLLNFLQDFLHIPGIIKYTIDAAWFVILLFMCLSHRPVVFKKVLPLMVLLAISGVYFFVSYLFNYQSVFYFLWGIRNNIRYYIAFFAFIYFLDKEDVALCLKYIDVLFVVHIIISFFQFFVLGYKWDYLGGIFGVQLGCNGNSMIFLVVVTIKSLLTYMHGKENLLICLLKCATSLVVAAMSELKFFFIIFLIIIVISAFVTKFSYKKILLMVLLLFVVFFAASVFTAIWGQDAALSFDRIFELVTSESYSSARDLGRFTAIPTISKTFLINLPKKLFGLGLGNCETSAFALFNTPFYQTYSYLNYDWLSSAFAFIETGYIGLFLFLSFFIFVLFCVIKQRKNGTDMYSEMSIIMCVICVCLFFYNSSLRTDFGYIVFWVLALPFISTTSESLFEKSVNGA